MKIGRTATFIRLYVRLPDHIRKKADRQILYLASDIRHPGVKARKMSNAGDVWEARVNGAYRMTFAIVDGEILLRKIGTHEIYRKP